MAKITLNDFANITGNETAAIAALNENNDLIEAAIENTLSRDGTMPNAMNNDFDMNGYDIINAGFINGQDANNLVGPQGPTGAMGATGPAGTNGTSFTWKGIYSGATAYEVNDNVSNQSSSWICIQATTGNAPPTLPTTNNTWWQLVAQKGADGTGSGDMLAATYDPSGIAQQVVGTTAIQTLTNKTLTSPVINTPTGIVKGDVGLGNVDNTSDANKPVSTAQATAIAAKLAGSTGPADNALLRADGTGGLTVQATGITVDDSNNVTGIAGLTAAGLVDLSGTAAGQIKFPGTQNPSSDVKTLDDYEEGTWTPAIGFGGNTTGITYGTPTLGRYTKIGHLVTIAGMITLTSKGTATGNVQMTGLPFVAANDQIFAAGSIGYVGFMSLTGAVTVMVQPNTSKLNFYQSAAASYAILNNSNFTNTSSIYFTVSYETT